MSIDSKTSIESAMIPAIPVTYARISPFGASGLGAISRSFSTLSMMSSDLSAFVRTRTSAVEPSSETDSGPCSWARFPAWPPASAPGSSAAPQTGPANGSTTVSTAFSSERSHEASGSGALDARDLERVREDRLAKSASSIPPSSRLYAIRASTSLPTSNSSSRMSLTSVDSADSGRKASFSLVVASWSFGWKPNRAKPTITQGAITTHFERRPVAKAEIRSQHRGVIVSIPA